MRNKEEILNKEVVNAMKTLLKYLIVIILLLLSLPAIIIASILIGIMLAADWIEEVVGAALDE